MIEYREAVESLEIKVSEEKKMIKRWRTREGSGEFGRDMEIKYLLKFLSLISFIRYHCKSFDP